ncbi:Mak32p [Sporobolomyces koalae]|uniref:Mak32p n=1 Tax=Sporobolomyces koalae TaxID=500713 RepID=UPI00316E87F0
MADSSIAVASLGLFILDTFEWRSPDSTAVIKRDTGVIGGGGTYAMVGSRIWLPANRVGILVDRGTDWDPQVEDKLNEFGPAMWIFRDKDGETTKALNLYTGEHRDFKYLTPRTRLEPQDLPAPFRSSQYLHFVCSPTRALEIRAQLDPRVNPTPTWQPALVYEPIPDRCIPEEMGSLREILPHIAIFSPNHEEAGSFYGLTPEQVHEQGQEGIERIARRFFDEGATGVVIIRSGAWGSYTLQRGEERGFWTSAFYPYDNAKAQKQVKDVTGAGNSFLGGLMAGLVRYPQDLRTAVECASVSASFIIEQFGLPTVETGGVTGELWNGCSPQDRLVDLQKRRR